MLYASAPFIYIPAWAYRFILKSTLWFWSILIIVGGAPQLDGGIEGLRADAYRKASAWVGIATAVFAVVDFGFGWLLKPWAENFAAHASLPTAVALLVLVDWKSIPVVQWITLASALTTIAVVIWTHDVCVDFRTRNAPPASGRNYRRSAPRPMEGWLRRGRHRSANAVLRPLRQRRPSLRSPYRLGGRLAALALRLRRRAPRPVA